MIRSVQYQDLVGLPWSRLNCYQLVREIYLRAGFYVEPEPTYSQWERTDGPREFGDVLALATKQNGVVDSVALALGDGRALTSVHKKHVAIVNERNIAAQITGAYRWKH